MSHILIADDEPDIRFELAEALRMKSYRVLEASDGDEALKALDDHEVDVAVIDILMPNREGLETIMDIRTKWPGTKIIAISGGDRLQNRDLLTLAKKFGASAVLKKPFSIIRFRRAVARAINQRVNRGSYMRGRMTVPLRIDVDADEC